MSDPTRFELLPTGGAFETAAIAAEEEQERGARRFGAAARAPSYRAVRHPPPYRAPTRAGAPPVRPPRVGPPPFGPPRPGRAGFWRPWRAVPVGWGAAAPFVAPGPDYYRCMQECLRPPPAAAPAAPAPEPGAADADAADAAPPEQQETTMHNSTCRCARCAPRGGAEAFEVMAFAAPPGRDGFGAPGGASRHEGSFGAQGETQYEGPYEAEDEGEYEGEYEWPGEAEAGGAPFSEAEEIALAAELLSVSSEAELEQFLGKLWQGVKKVGSVVGKIAKPFSGVLKAVAKKALPFVGGALGSFIPIPGVGTAVGSALGGALSKALELELAGLELEDREFEMARRFVRIAGTAAQQLAQGAPPGGDAQAAVQAAVAAAAQRHLPTFQATAAAKRDAGPRMAGRWIRNGRTLIVVGA
jgi:hypothetical protein